MHSEKGIAVSAEFCRTESPVLFHSLLQRNYVKYNSCTRRMLKAEPSGVTLPTKKEKQRDSKQVNEAIQFGGVRTKKSTRLIRQEVE